MADDLITQSYGEAAVMLPEGWYSRSDLMKLLEHMDKMDEANRKSMQPCPKE